MHFTQIIVGVHWTLRKILLQTGIAYFSISFNYGDADDTAKCALSDVASPQRNATQRNAPASALVVQTRIAASSMLTNIISNELRRPRTS